MDDNITLLLVFVIIGQVYSGCVPTNICWSDSCDAVDAVYRYVCDDDSFVKEKYNDPYSVACNASSAEYGIDGFPNRTFLASHLAEEYGKCEGCDSYVLYRDFQMEHCLSITDCNSSITTHTDWLFPLGCSNNEKDWFHADFCESQEITCTDFSFKRTCFSDPDCKSSTTKFVIEMENGCGYIQKYVNVREYYNIKVLHCGTYTKCVKVVWAIIVVVSFISY
eukprot:162712_1